MAERINEIEALRRLEELDPAFEMGHQYARVERKTKMPDGKFETDGEHVTSLGMICVAYATKYRPDLDPYKLSFYLLFHDLDEYLYGDESSLGVTPEQYAAKVAKEEEAADERRQRLAAFPEFMKLLDTLDDLSIPEFAFAKAFDKLAPSFTHINNGGQVIKDDYGYGSYEDIVEGNRTVFEKMEQYASEFQDVIEMKRATVRRIAQVAFTQPAESKSSHE